MILFALACSHLDISETTNDLVGQWLVIDTEYESALLFLVPVLVNTEGDLWYRDSSMPYENPTDNDYGGTWNFEKADSIHIEFSEGLQEDLYSPVDNLTFKIEPIEDNCYDVWVVEQRVKNYVGTICPYDGLYWY